MTVIPLTAFTTENRFFWFSALAAFWNFCLEILQSSIYFVISDVFIFPCCFTRFNIILNEFHYLFWKKKKKNDISYKWYHSKVFISRDISIPFSKYLSRRSAKASEISSYYAKYIHVSSINICKIYTSFSTKPNCWNSRHL